MALVAMLEQSFGSIADIVRAHARETPRHVAPGVFLAECGFAACPLCRFMLGGNIPARQNPGAIPMLTRSPIPDP